MIEFRLIVLLTCSCRLEKRKSVLLRGLQEFKLIQGRDLVLLPHLGNPSTLPPPTSTLAEKKYLQLNNKIEKDLCIAEF